MAFSTNVWLFTAYIVTTNLSEMPRISHDAPSSVVPAFAFPGRVRVRFSGLLGPEVQKRSHSSLFTQFVHMHLKINFTIWMCQKHRWWNKKQPYHNTHRWHAFLNQFTTMWIIQRQDSRTKDIKHIRTILKTHFFKYFIFNLNIFCLLEAEHWRPKLVVPKPFSDCTKHGNSISTSCSKLKLITDTAWWNTWKSCLFNLYTIQ